MTQNTRPGEHRPSSRNRTSTGGVLPQKVPASTRSRTCGTKLKFFLESKVKPWNKHKLVEGIKKFWRKKITPEKCAKYIDHVLHKAIPAVVEAEGAATKY